MREPGRRSSRDGTALFGAVLLHVAALLLIAHVESSPVATPARTADALADALDVDLVPLGPSDTALGDAAEPSDAAVAADASNTALSGRARSSASSERVAVSDRARQAAPSDALELADQASIPSGPAETPIASPSGTPAEHPIDLGLGADGWQRWLSADHTSRVPRPERAPGTPIVRAPPVSSTGGLVEGLVEADRERLVGPSGRVMNALENAAHGDGAMAFGAARFAVTVLRTGSVEVTLEGASGGDAEWKRVAERAAENLRANAPPIHPPSEGARFVVELSAEMRLPDGTRVAELHGLRVEPVPPRIQTWQAGEKDMILKNPTAASGLSRTDQIRANVDLPGVYVAERGKVCGYRFGISVLGPLLQGGCDLSNLGTKPQRVVHAHVSSSELF